MPNHLHLVFIPIVERDLSRSPVNFSDINIALQYPVTDILRKLKGSTSRACNLALNRTGAFWQHESYDHVVRDSDELKRIVNYVLNNPVKAGLVEYPEQWDYSYVNYDLIPVL
jgi:REP element-mobilizing transposase RayT